MWAQSSGGNSSSWWITELHLWSPHLKKSETVVFCCFIVFLGLSQGFISCPGWPCSIVQAGLELSVLCLNLPSSLDDRPESQTWLVYISWNGGTPSLSKMEFADKPFGGIACMIYGVLAGPLMNGV